MGYVQVPIRMASCHLRKTTDQGRERGVAAGIGHAAKIDAI
jgi:hypothetical protein